MISENRIEKIASSITSAAGMSDEAFRAVVYRLVKKIAIRYGGTSRGSIAQGRLSDGTTWSATVLRSNASNGETFGILQLVVTPVGQSSKTIQTYNDWEMSFEKAGIPAVSSMRISSRDMQSDFGDATRFFNIADFLETVDKSSFMPAQVNFFQRLVEDASSERLNEVIRRQIDIFDHALIRYGLKKKGRVL